MKRAIESLHGTLQVIQRELVNAEANIKINTEALAKWSKTRDRLIRDKTATLSAIAILNSQNGQNGEVP